LKADRRRLWHSLAELDDDLNTEGLLVSARAPRKATM